MYTGIAELQLSDTRNVVMSTDDGRLQIYGAPPNLKSGKELDVINSHIGAVTGINKSGDNKILVTSGADGTIFIYRVSESATSNRIGRQTKKLNMRIGDIERDIKRKIAAS